MDALETRAGDLLDRLTDCGLGGGLTEEDLFGHAVREPLRTCCTQLAERLWALGQKVEVADLRALQGAVNDLRQQASSEQAAAAGRLDASILRLAQALDHAFEPTPAPASGKASARLEALELLAASLQGAAMLAAAAQQVEQAAAGAAGTAGAQQAKQQGEGEAEAEEVMQDPAAVELSRGLRIVGELLEVSPPPGVPGGFPTAAALLGSLAKGMSAALAALPPGFFAPLLPPGSLDAQQLSTLREVDAALRSEYSLRRRMLVERAGVTLRSFLWSSCLEERGTKAQAEAAVASAQEHMAAEPAVALDDVFATTAGDLLTIMERATSGESGVEASVKGVLIGSVPDRGGRPEGRARVADMPAWSARRVTEGGGRGGRGGRRGGGGGGRVQGGWQGGSKGGGGGSGGGGGGQWGHGGRGSGGRGGQFEFQGAAKRGRSTR